MVFYFDYLIPGIKARVQKYGYDVRWNGFIPVVDFGDTTIEIDQNHINNLAHQDNYDGIFEYIDNIIMKRPILTNTDSAGVTE